MMVISRDVGRELCPSDAALKDRENEGGKKPRARACSRSAESVEPPKHEARERRAAVERELQEAQAQAVEGSRGR